MGWVYRDLCNSPSVLGSFWAVSPGRRKSARVVPRPAPCELASRHKPGGFGANFGAVFGAVLGSARLAGSNSRGPKPDIDCYQGPDRAKASSTTPYAPMGFGEGRPSIGSLVEKVRSYTRFRLGAEHTGPTAVQSCSGKSYFRLEYIIIIIVFIIPMRP
jgi:hypothetical protein